MFDCCWNLIDSIFSDACAFLSFFGLESSIESFAVILCIIIDGGYGRRVVSIVWLGWVSSICVYCSFGFY